MRTEADIFETSDLRWEKFFSVLAAAVIFAFLGEFIVRYLGQDLSLDLRITLHIAIALISVFSVVVGAVWAYDWKIVLLAISPVVLFFGSFWLFGPWTTLIICGLIAFVPASRFFGFRSTAITYLFVIVAILIGGMTPLYHIG